MQPNPIQKLGHVEGAVCNTAGEGFHAGMISWEHFVFEEGGESFPRRNLGLPAVQ